ncbi:MAG: VWA domain-containing protein [Terracidiphilus sp.]
MFAGALLACAQLAPAQSAPKQPASLLVNALDRNGNAVRDLTKDNFRVEVNGHPTALLDARYSSAPRRIVVLLDMSGSMAGGTEKNKKWETARGAVEALLTETPADVQVALVTFSSKVHDVLDFSQGRSSITAWLNRGSSQWTEVKGFTAFYDAAAAAANLLEPSLPGDSVYAITDGGDNSSHISEAATKQRLLHSQIRLFMFLFSESVRTQEERLGEDSVVELARDTGGFVFGLSGQRNSPWTFDYRYDSSGKTEEGIKLQTRALNMQVNGFYTLKLDAPPRTSKSSKVSLEIVDGSGKVRKSLAWTYQRALPAQSK